MDNQNIKQYKFIELEGVKLFVMRSGLIFRLTKNKGWKMIENKKNHSKGYNYIKIHRKAVRRHRIIGYTFLNLDITNTKLQIDHIDGDRLNNNIDNLRIVTNQQNQWNQTKAKGYYWSKFHKKWRAVIGIDYKRLYLGYYTSEEEAHQAYVNAKLIYHKI